MLYVSQFLQLYSYIILARVIASWLVRDPNHPVYRFLSVPTEPVLAPLRKLVPPEKLSGLDISPILAFVLINYLQRFLAGAI